MTRAHIPFIPAGLTSQQDLDNAGIPANVIIGPSGTAIQMAPTATSDDLQAAQALVATLAGEPQPVYTSQKQIALTNKWLSVKACLDALPAAPNVGPDPHGVSRLRLVAEVQSALDGLIDAGGPG